MSEEPTGMNPDDDLPPDARKALEDFERLMKDVNDPVVSGYSVIAEMYNGFRAAGMERIDAYCLVAAYLVLHDHMGREEDS
jgi:hypothetical protein